MGFLVIVALILVIAPVWASDDDDDSDGNGGSCNGIANCNTHNDGGDGYGGDGYGGEGGDGGTGTGYGGEGGEGGDADASSNSESEANSTSSAGAEAGASVINNITGDTIPADTTHRAKITIENTPDIVTITPASGDTCKAHIGFGVSIPGLGTSMNIPLPGKECRKLKAYDRAIAMRQWRAAEIMFCALKEVKAEFKEHGLVCVDILTLHLHPLTPDPKPDNPRPTAGKVVITEDEYHGLLLAQVQAEDYEKQQQMVADKFAQYDSLIEERQAEHERDDAEIERLKYEAAALRKLEQEREQREMVQQSAFGLLYDNRVAQEIEEPIQTEEESNE